MLKILRCLCGRNFYITEKIFCMGHFLAYINHNLGGGQNFIKIFSGRDKLMYILHIFIFIYMKNLNNKSTICIKQWLRKSHPPLNISYRYTERPLENCTKHLIKKKSFRILLVLLRKHNIQKNCPVKSKCKIKGKISPLLPQQIFPSRNFSILLN